MGEIYKITCIPNGKLYIGQTTQGTNKRWKQHVRGDNVRTSHISAAIKKYNKQNFKVEVIHVTSMIHELDDLEKYYISYYKSLTPNGYNICPGGVSFRDHYSTCKKQIIVWNEKDKIDMDFDSYNKAAIKFKLHARSIARGCKTGFSVGEKDGIKYYARYPGTPQVIKERKRDIRKILNNKQCEEIHKMYIEKTMNQYELAEYFEISQPLVHKIVNGNYEKKRHEIKVQKRLTKQEREDIKFFYNLGIFTTQQEIAYFYDTSPRTVRRIINN